MAKARPAPMPTTGPPPRRVRQLITPEGVDLRLELAEVSERASAFLLDLAIMVGILILASILALFAAWAARRQTGVMQWIGVIWLVVAFLLRNAYFVGFELRTGAATPGKRALGLRVATRNGGRLTADAVIARNAMRELEFYIPLSTILVAPREQIDAWMTLAGVVWSGIFLLFPLFNRDRLRAGDLIAGTWVVKAPRRRLSPDMASENLQPGRFDFTAAQVEAYGVMELQVLEDVLRRADRPTMKAVATRIRAKIGWVERADEGDREFLDAYYTALRRRLESGLLFGKRRKDKFDK
ncbi:RDD family protein [soil metagenome]